MKLHQFQPTLAPQDATSDAVFALRGLFRSLGHEAEAYAAEIKAGVDGARPYRRLFRAGLGREDALLLHFGIGHDAFVALGALEARKILVYHNVTPPEFFAETNPYAARHARLGLSQLPLLAERVDLAVGVSEFNRKALEVAGFARTATAPLLVDWAAYDLAPDEAVLRRFAGGGAKLLFVGRVAPNKRQDDLVRVLAYYRRAVDPMAQLLLVGDDRDQPRYLERLRALAARLGVADAVHLAGRVSRAALAAYYRSASVFVSLSQHEGFGLPLLEAMKFRLPVVAFDAAAVGETLGAGAAGEALGGAGAAGVLLRERDPALVAETCALVLEREDLRERLVAAGERRLADFAYDRVAARWREVLGL